MHHVTILDTLDLTDEFENALQHYLCKEDRLEFYRQLFQHLDQPNAVEVCALKVADCVNLLDYSSLVFANHLKLDYARLNLIVYRILEKLAQILQYRNFYVNGSLMYLPFSMNGPDLCVRRYNS